MNCIKYTTLIAFATLLLVACNNNPKPSAAAKNDSMSMPSPQIDSAKFKAAQVDNLKDPVCGMPVGAGIEDTLHYNRKVIGFCSKECKDEFLKNTAKNMIAVEWKK